MYCSSCGVAVARGLSYCNHCGARLGGAEGVGVNKPSELFSESLVWAIVTVFIVGLGCIIGLMAVMKNVLDFKAGLIIFFTSLSFLLTFAVEGVLVWLLLSRRGAAKEARDTARPDEQATKELEAAQARVLPEPVPSVTEHATRAFEPSYGERKSK